MTDNNILQENERLKALVKHLTDNWHSDLPTTNIAYKKWEQLKQQGATPIGVLFEKDNKVGAIDNYGKVIWFPED